MKNFLKLFFKKLWAIFIRLFYCFAPYLYYLQKAETKPAVADEDVQDADKQEAEKTE